MSTQGVAPPEPPEPPDPLRPLREGRYLSVTSFRLDGRAVATPVWFIESDGILWSRSASDSGKVKRIRVTPAVRLAPCERDGTVTAPAVTAQATVVERDGHRDHYKAILHRYGRLARFYDAYWTRLRRTDTVLLRFAPDGPERPASRGAGPRSTG